MAKTSSSAPAPRRKASHKLSAPPPHAASASKAERRLPGVSEQLAAVKAEFAAVAATLLGPESAKKSLKLQHAKLHDCLREALAAQLQVVVERRNSLKAAHRAEVAKGESESDALVQNIRDRQAKHHELLKELGRKVAEDIKSEAAALIAQARSSAAK